MIDFQICNERYDRCGVHFIFEHRIRTNFRTGNDRYERCGAHLLSANRPLIDLKNKVNERHKRYVDHFLVKNLLMINLIFRIGNEERTRDVGWVTVLSNSHPILIEFRYLQFFSIKTTSGRCLSAKPAFPI